MNLTQARGFVLSATAYAEADKIVQLYTLQLGRVKAIVKGIRKPKSKLASSIDLFTESAFSLHKKASGSLYVLGQAKIVNGYAELKKYFQVITVLQVLADLLAQALPEGEPHPEIYSLVKEVLAALKANPEMSELFLTAFVIKLLDLMGYPLELETCTECGILLERKKAFLIPHRGGALCENCCATGPARLKVAPMTLEIFKKFKTLPMEKIHILKLKPRLVRDNFLTVLDYLERTIEKRLKTVEYYLKVLPLEESAK